jgi:ribonuclease HIII
LTSEEKAKLLTDDYKERLISEGFSVSDSVRGSYSFEIVINSGSERIKLLTYFSSKGNKTLLQGNKDSDLYKQVNRIIFGELLFGSSEEINEPENYIGTDESGKGDFFGPLVTAGVYADENIRKKLLAVGVKDSKMLSTSAIISIDEKIKAIHGIKYNIVVINPEKYNILYDKFKNLNRLLGWAHARVLENILAVQDSPAAISDKFGDERFIIASLQAKGKNLNLLQYHKAEKYTAVAAASILARRRMLSWFEIQNNKYGFMIPKGSSGLVEQAAKKIKTEYGIEELDQLIKKHFKTSQKL